jgi:hypothetical protein
MATKKRVRTPDPAAGTPSGAMMETYPCIAYQLKGILYLPHYSEKFYIRPSYGITHFDSYLGIELRALGAKPVELALWKRSHF